VVSFQSAEQQEYMVSKDGQRFLINSLVEDTDSAITFVLNWAPPCLDTPASNSTENFVPLEPDFLLVIQNTSCFKKACVGMGISGGRTLCDSIKRGNCVTAQKM
jgi:hypothetical protein